MFSHFSFFSNHANKSCFIALEYGSFQVLYLFTNFFTRKCTRTSKPPVHLLPIRIREGSRLATLRLPRHTHHTAQNTKLQTLSSPVFQQKVLVDERVTILSYFYFSTKKKRLQGRDEIGERIQLQVGILRRLRTRVRGDVRYRILIELAVGGCRIGACVGVLAGCRVRGRRLTVGSRGGIGVLGIRGRRLSVGSRGLHGIGIRGIAVVRILGGASCIRCKWDPIRHYNCGFLCCVQCHAYPGEDADKE
jgi:hypothetical protein